MVLRWAFPYVAAGAGIIFVGYCIYFDKKRRSHPDFWKNLRKKRIKQKALEAQKLSSFPLPPINDHNAMQRFFIQQIQQGELALKMGSLDEGVNHFAIAVSVCGQPNQLLPVLQQSLSPAVFLRLLEILPSVQSKYQTITANRTSSGREIEEDLE
ncbi:hypothetical protein MN116_008940 [Schistosoma mekongi]|uniref:Mitochondrial import receptor subunit TOM20 n=1 Tax=Schistosoma mekongi TaxID=38744 RepID=A0AAE2D1Q5_SCHME|nr:hypothetical protein MN116_008940 [Schistosoma mekongi]